MVADMFRARVEQELEEFFLKPAFFLGDFCSTWKAKCPIFKAIVAGFRGKVDQKIGHLAFQAWNFIQIVHGNLRGGIPQMPPPKRNKAL